jgi:hypothetical protein
VGRIQHRAEMLPRGLYSFSPFPFSFLSVLFCYFAKDFSLKFETIFLNWSQNFPLFGELQEGF